MTSLCVSRLIALLLVVANCTLDRIFCKHRAMELDGWQAELLCDFGVSDCASLFECHALYALGHVGRRSDGGTATKSLETDIFDDTGFADLDRKLHHIATSRSADETDTDILVTLEEGADLFKKKEKKKKRDDLISTTSETRNLSDGSESYDSRF